MQFEPAPRRGEPDVTRRTPDYFLWLKLVWRCRILTASASWLVHLLRAFFKSKSINSQWWWVGWVAESMYNGQVELPWFNWFADYARVSIRGSSGAGDQIAANVPFPANNAASFIPLPWFCFCYLIPFCRRMVVSGLGMCRETMSWLIMGAFIFFLTKCSSRCLNISR
jgi:hypothetical protein